MTVQIKNLELALDTARSSRTEREEDQESELIESKEKLAEIYQTLEVVKWEKQMADESS